MSVDREHVLAALRAKRDEIERRYGVRMIGIVGSVARGQDRSGSDIDILVDIIRTPSLFQLSRAERELEGTIGVGLPVELVLREGMRPRARERIERDLIALS